MKRSSSVLVLIASILLLVACSPVVETTAPTLTQTTDKATPTRTPTETSIPSETPAAVATVTLKPECSIESPEQAIVLDPRNSVEAGWCEVEYGDFTISYPNQWIIGAGGVWMQNRTFKVSMNGVQSPFIMVLAGETTYGLAEVDKTVLIYKDGGKTYQEPVIGQYETDLETNIQNIGGTDVLVATTKLGESTQRRYFWVNPNPFWKDRKMFVYFLVQGLTIDFEKSDYSGLLAMMEKVIFRVHPTPTCADGYTRLHRGIYAQVTTGVLPNRVRSGPSKKDEIIAQLYSGTILYLLDGPVCADGMVFWRVNNQNIPGNDGWMAEGDFNEYYMEPYEP